MTQQQLNCLLKNLFSLITKKSSKPRGVFHQRFTSSPKYYLKICVLQKSYSLWEFQAETLYVRPKNRIALGTHSKFQLEILTINVISSIVYFGEIILESAQNVSQTTLCITGPFVKEIHQSPVDFLHKRGIMCKVCLCHSITIQLIRSIFSQKCLPMSVV